MSRWFIPNPASVEPTVLAAQVTPPGVGTLLQAPILSERLREFFFPSSVSPVLISCLREGLLQMTIESFSDRKILMIVNGPMSQEWFDIADDCRGNVHIFDAAYDTDLDLNAFALALQKEKYDLLLFTETDVYTGTTLPVRGICTAFRSLCPDGLIITDISGSVFCGNDAAIAAETDICLCGSEIAMGITPGLGVVIPNERAHTRLLAHNMMNGRYFNYPRRTVSRSSSALDVPPYPLLHALNEQISLILTEGVPARVQRIGAARDWIRQWAAARGFPVFAAETSRAFNCTTLELPAELNPQEITDFANRYGIFLSPGVGLMPKNTLCIYHGNDVRPEDVSALTRVLDRFLADYDTRRRRMPQAQKPQEQKV